MTLFLVAIAAGVTDFLVIRLEVFQTEEKASPVTVVVERRDVLSTLPTIGNVEFGTVVDLGFEQAGILKTLNVDEGDIVPAGTVLAQLDVTDLSRAVDDAASALRQAEVQLEQLARPPRGDEHRTRRA